jgi:acetyl esterase/lipase
MTPEFRSPPRAPQTPAKHSRKLKIIERSRWHMSVVLPSQLDKEISRLIRATIAFKDAQKSADVQPSTEDRRDQMSALCRQCVAGADQACFNNIVIEDIRINSNVFVRIYTDSTAQTSTGNVLLYFHGGGFCIVSIDSFLFIVFPSMLSNLIFMLSVREKWTITIFK